MDEYINEYNVIIDRLVKNLDRENMPLKYKNALNENEILELQNKVHINIKKEILRIIGYSTYDIIEKNIHINDKYRDIYQICAPTKYGDSTSIYNFYNRTKYNEITDLDGNKYLNMFEYFYKNYRTHDSIFQPKKYDVWRIIYKYILAMNDLEYELLDYLIEENNNYFNVIPKDITETIRLYLKSDAYFDFDEYDEYYGYNTNDYNCLGESPDDQNDIQDYDYDDDTD